MVRFSRYIGNTVSSIHTIQNYTGGVRKLHKIAAYEAPNPGEANFKLIIQALCAELARPVKQAWPVTPNLLREIYDQVNLSDPMEVVCYGAMLVGFYLLLRKSNLVPDSSISFNPNEQLTRADVLMAGWMVLINIRWSKTIQYKQKEILMPLIPAPCRAICPIYWVRYIMKMFPTDPNHYSVTIRKARWWQ